MATRKRIAARRLTIRRRYFGFTLVELMIAVVIIAILASIAVPGYQNYVRQTRRSDAQVALTRTANQLEKYFTFCNRYTGSMTGTWPGSCPPEPAGSGLGYANQLSPDRHYFLSINSTNSSGTGTIETAYTITADPDPASGATGRQNGDGRLRLDSRGIKQWDKNNDGDYTDPGENSWQR